MLIKQRNKLFELKIPKSLKIIYIHGKGLGVFANKNFKKGETVLHFKADVVPHSKASSEAVPIDDKVSLDTKWLVLDIAIKNIRKNEEITYNYNTTEYDMEKSRDAFKCECGSKNCVGKVRGFKYLTQAQKLKLKPFLTPFLEKRLNP